MDQISTSLETSSASGVIAFDEEGKVDTKLLELIGLRIAQLHHCPESTDVHLDRLRRLGETEGRLNQLKEWAECGLFDERERAAMRFCERISLESPEPFPNLLIQEMRHYFTKDAIVSLAAAAMAGNDWHFSRRAQSFR